MSPEAAEITRQRARHFADQYASAWGGAITASVTLASQTMRDWDVKQVPSGASGEPVATYVFSGPLDYAIRGFTTGSQYLLYENGVFGLRYDAFPHVYLGTYRLEYATITFSFDGKWTSDKGTAMGTLQGDLLEVRYSDIMQHSDFENAVYQRSQ